MFGHPIRDQNSVSFFNLLDNFKIGTDLAAFYLLSFFGILVVIILINGLSHRMKFGATQNINIGKRVASVVSSLEVKRLSAISVFVLFVHLFIWIHELFLTNNIKTNKVVWSGNFAQSDIKNSKRFYILFQVVDTSQLIKDEHDIFNSPRMACMVKGNQLDQMISSSPVKGTLFKIYNEKTKLRPEMKKERELLDGDRCWLGRDPKVCFYTASKCPYHILR